MKRFLENIFSGIGGVILTLAFQYFFYEPQSFTFIYRGNELVVTESTYTELIEENEKMGNNILSLEEQIQELQDELENRNSKETIAQIIRDATKFWNNAEYVQALVLLRNYGTDSSDILTLYNSYSLQYCDYVLKMVDGLLEERKYDEARELILESKALVANSIELENKLTEINNKIPLKLSNFKISASRYFELSESKPTEDTVGNKYYSTNIFVIRAEGESEYGYGTFYLGQKYNSMSGTIAVSDKSENQLNGWIEIYSKSGDEYSHIYTSPVLSRMTSPITVPEVNLTSADWLEIRYYNCGEYFSLAGGYHSLEVLLADFMIYCD